MSLINIPKAGNNIFINYNSIKDSQVATEFPHKMVFKWWGGRHGNKLEMTHRACVTKEWPVNFTVNQVIPCVGRLHKHCSCLDCYLSKNNRQ